MMQCASTPGCFIDENECKNMGGGGMEAPEAPEAPEVNFIFYARLIASNTAKIFNTTY